MLAGDMSKELLGNDRPSVVVGHDMGWANHNIVACFYDFAIRKANGMVLNDLFDDGLRNAKSMMG